MVLKAGRPACAQPLTILSLDPLGCQVPGGGSEGHVGHLRLRHALLLGIYNPLAFDQRVCQLGHQIAHLVVGSILGPMERGAEDGHKEDEVGEAE